MVIFNDKVPGRIQETWSNDECSRRKFRQKENMKIMISKITNIKIKK